ncbi:unnamed protein product [Didymodactylos carnosus]|uniref:Uncharacterized protein n=1 Tax=Didymodactylos carnosus TaxID=1234261 RepID=A0A813RQU4_9BILA|nr:unnamed protein product [Didymodactylos carnosus]CAF3568214.1 unnamed protein product [Didymodactylos carnosus]
MFGCPYNFHPDKPWLRRTIRGLVASGIAISSPVIAVGAITAAVAVLPPLAVYRLVKHIREKKQVTPPWLPTDERGFQVFNEFNEGQTIYPEDVLQVLRERFPDLIDQRDQARRELQNDDDGFYSPTFTSDVQDDNETCSPNGWNIPKASQNFSNFIFNWRLFRKPRTTQTISMKYFEQRLLPRDGTTKKCVTALLYKIDFSRRAEGFEKIF